MFPWQVIGLRDVIPPPLRREFNDVYIATELMDTDLHHIIRSNQNLSEEHSQVSAFNFFFKYIIIIMFTFWIFIHKLHKDATNRPHIYSRGVIRGIQQQFGSSVPSCDYIFCHEVTFQSWSRKTKINNLQVTIWV